MWLFCLKLVQKQVLFNFCLSLIVVVAKRVADVVTVIIVDVVDICLKVVGSQEHGRGGYRNRCQYLDPQTFFCQFGVAFVTVVARIVVEMVSSPQCG